MRRRESAPRADEGGLPTRFFGTQLSEFPGHGLGLYYRPIEGRDAECDTARWIVEGWTILVQKALALPFQEPHWLGLPVMRRVAITTPNVMTALRKLNRDQARPYNFALSPVITNLSREQILLLGPFTKDSRRWRTMDYVNIYDGKIHTLKPPTLLAVPHTFDLMFVQYWQHPEFKSLAPDGTPCKGDTRGLLKCCPVTASGVRLIGKETERGWEQDDDISTLLPSLVQYDATHAVVESRLRETLRNTPLDVLQETTGLSRHTLVRARRAKFTPQISTRAFKGDRGVFARDHPQDVKLSVTTSLEKV